jgi:serine protease
MLFKHSIRMVLGAALLTACATANTESDPPTWEEYKAQATQTAEDGRVYYRIGGDIVVGEKVLREAYDQLVTYLNNEARGIGTAEQASTVMTVNGQDDIWNTTQRKNLTYCVDNAWGADKQRVINEMASATGAWEAVANVDFKYVPAQDGNCGSAPTGVVFSVRKQASGGGCAFFPSFPQSCEGTRVVTYSLLNVPGGPPVTTTGILRHELGHVLGLRHEHIRSGFTCNGGNEQTSNSRNVTSYDSASVMHYPWCQGATNTGDLDITTRDAEGARLLYGPPGGGGAVCGNGAVEAGEQCDDGNTTSGDGCSSTCQTEGTGTQTTDTKSGSVARRAFVHFPAYTVTPGTQLKAVLTGTGDPDLYVRWGANATTTQWNCRPYLDGANETCTLTVPANVTAAHVSVRGFTAATYSVITTYTKP